MKIYTLHHARSVISTVCIFTYPFFQVCPKPFQTRFSGSSEAGGEAPLPPPTPFSSAPPSALSTSELRGSGAHAPCSNPARDAPSRPPHAAAQRVREHQGGSLDDGAVFAARCLPVVLVRPVSRTEGPGRGRGGSEAPRGPIPLQPSVPPRGPVASVKSSAALHYNPPGAIRTLAVRPVRPHPPT